MRRYRSWWVCCTRSRARRTSSAWTSASTRTIRHASTPRSRWRACGRPRETDDSRRRTDRGRSRRPLPLPPLPHRHRRPRAAPARHARRPAREGTVEVHAGEWRSSAGPLVAVGTLHAERASFGWRLVGDRLALTSLELHGPDVSAEGEGTVRLAAPLEASGLELRLAVAAAPEAPDRVRAPLRLLPAPPRDPARPRRLVVARTLARPPVLAPRAR